MTWVKIEDDLPDHPKIAGLSDAAFRLHIAGICYCSRHLTDGFIPAWIIDRWGVKRADKVAAELEAASLWLRHSDEYEVVGYLDHQRSKAEAQAVSAKRSEAGKRGGKASAKAKQVASALLSNEPSKAQAEENRETDTEEITTSVAIATDAGRPDVEALCEHLANAVEANGSLRPTITDRWRTACRLMVDKDGRTPEQIRNAIDWSQADEFWRPNVMSMPKLREKYDQLRLAAQRSRPTARTEQAADGYRALREQMAQVDDLDGRALGEAS